MFTNNEPWMAEGICLQVGGELWFPDAGDGRACREAKAVCSVCPVAPECLDYAFRNFIHTGVWGGKSEMERRKLLKERAA